MILVDYKGGAAFAPLRVAAARRRDHRQPGRRRRPHRAGAREHRRRGGAPPAGARATPAARRRSPTTASCARSSRTCRRCRTCCWSSTSSASCSPPSPTSSTCCSPSAASAAPSACTCCCPASASRSGKLRGPGDVPVLPARAAHVLRGGEHRRAGHPRRVPPAGRARLRLPQGRHERLPAVPRRLRLRPGALGDACRSRTSTRSCTGRSCSPCTTACSPPTASRPAAAARSSWSGRPSVRRWWTSSSGSCRAWRRPRVRSGCRRCRRACRSAGCSATQHRAPRPVPDGPARRPRQAAAGAVAAGPDARRRPRRRHRRPADRAGPPCCGPWPPGSRSRTRRGRWRSTGWTSPAAASRGSRGSRTSAGSRRGPAATGCGGCSRSCTACSRCASACSRTTGSTRSRSCAPSTPPGACPSSPPRTWSCWSTAWARCGPTSRSSTSRSPTCSRAAAGSGSTSSRP